MRQDAQFPIDQNQATGSSGAWCFSQDSRVRRGATTPRSRQTRRPARSLPEAGRDQPAAHRKGRATLDREQPAFERGPRPLPAGEATRPRRPPAPKPKPKSSGLAGQGAWEKAIERDRAVARRCRRCPVGRGRRDLGRRCGNRSHRGSATASSARSHSRPSTTTTREDSAFSTEDDEFELRSRAELQVDNLIFPGPAQQYIHGGTYHPAGSILLSGAFLQAHRLPDLVSAEPHFIWPAQRLLELQL